jgi:hypothetical protein
VAFFRGYVFEVEADLVHVGVLSGLRRRGRVSRSLKPATVFVGLNRADVHFIHHVEHMCNM